MAFQQNAQISGLDMSALAGISPEQLAAIARLFQAGALTLPPPAPEQPAQAREAAASTVRTQSTAAPLQQVSNDTVIQEEDVDMDKEEGELEEGEVGDSPRERDFLRPPPTGPRNRSVSPRNSIQPRASSRSSLHGEPLNRNNRSRPQNHRDGHHNILTNGHVHPAKDAEAKAFVLQMVNSGYSFEDLAKEVRNPEPLIRMFRQLGLQTSTEWSADRITKSNAMGILQPPAQSTTVVPPQNEEIRQSPAQSTTVMPPQNEEIRKSTAMKRLEPGKPLDRKDYLARLQAAKNKKADTVPVQAPQNTTTEPPAAPTDPRKQAPAPVAKGAGSVPGQPAANTTAESKTELARRRLEELKAQQAARQNATRANGTSMTSPIPERVDPPTTHRQTVSSPMQAGLSATLAYIDARGSQAAALEPEQMSALLAETQPPPPSTEVQPVFSPPPPTPSRSFSGLPGLFMVGASSQPQPPTPSQEPSMIPSAPMQNASGPTVTLPQSNILPTSTQKYGVSPSASPASFVVPRKRPVAADFNDASSKPSQPKRPFGQSRGASEDDSVIIEVSDDEDEDEVMSGIETAITAGQQTTSFRDVGPLRDFPPKPSFQVQASGQSTPGGNTPGGMTYEQRVKEIEAMKRKIAQAEKRKQANGKPGAGKINEAAVTLGTPGAPEDQLSLATPLSKKQEREMLKRRLMKLEREKLQAAPEAVVLAVEDTAGIASKDGKDVTARTASLEPVQAPSELEKPEATSHVNGGSPSEEGELSDDSMSNVYEMQNAQDTSIATPTPARNNEISQSTTSSAKSQDEASKPIEEIAGQDDITAGVQTDFHNGFVQDVDMEVDAEATAQLGIATPVETEMPDSLPQDLDFPAVEHEPVELSESMSDDEDEEEGEIKDDDSGDSESDDDNNDLDKPLTNRQTQTISTQLDALINDSIVEEYHRNDLEAPASPDNPEDRGSEPGEPMTSSVDDVGNIGVEASISATSVNANETVAAKDLTADDLAPELQPDAEEQTGLANQVRGSPEESGLQLIYRNTGTHRN